MPGHARLLLKYENRMRAMGKSEMKYSWSVLLFLRVSAQSILSSYPSLSASRAIWFLWFASLFIVLIISIDSIKDGRREVDDCLCGMDTSRWERRDQGYARTRPKTNADIDREMQEMMEDEEVKMQVERHKKIQMGEYEEMGLVGSPRRRRWRVARVCQREPAGRDCDGTAKRSQRKGK